MPFFDFLADLEFYAEHKNAVMRMNKRRRFLIEPFVDDIKGARVLDLASYDGRWCYAFAGAGAKKVTGIEVRPELVRQFQNYPDATLRDRVDLRVGDLYNFIDDEIRRGSQYDVIGVFGILYHLMDHFRLFQTLRKFNPKLVIVDSEFMLKPAPVIQLVREKTEKKLNAAPQYKGQKVALKGVPSIPAMEAIADCLNYDLEWIDWSILEDRKAVIDYFRKERMQRKTCVLKLRNRQQ